MQGNYHPDLGERVSSWEKDQMERNIINHLLPQPSAKQKGLHLLTNRNNLHCRKLHLIKLLIITSIRIKIFFPHLHCTGINE